MKLIRFLFLCITFISTQLHAQEDNTMPLFSKPTVFNQKPYFTLNFTVSGCIYEFRVNDVPIFSDPEGGYLTSAIPINEWMLSGENTVSMYLQPMSHASDVAKEGQSCNISLSLQVRDIDADESQNKIISQINYHSNPISLTSTEAAIADSTMAGSYIWDNGLKKDQKGNIILGNITLTPEKEKYGMGVIIKRDFTLPKLPFPKWAWLNGEILADNQTTHDELVQQYQIIWDAINSRKKAELSSDFLLRATELSKAYYLSDTKKEILELVNSIESDSKNNKMELVSIIPKYIFLKIFGNAKLARLAIWNGDPIIFFNYKDGSANSSYDIIYAKLNGKWVIVR